MVQDEWTGRQKLQILGEEPNYGRAPLSTEIAPNPQRRLGVAESDEEHPEHRHAGRGDD